MDPNYWLSIKNKLRQKISLVLLQVWVDPLEVELRDKVLYLSAPNDFVAKWVSKNLLTHISEATKEVLGDVKVELVPFEGVDIAKREFITDVSSYYGAEQIYTSIHNMTEAIKKSKWGSPLYGYQDGRIVTGENSIRKNFDGILDGVINFFKLEFKQIMQPESEVEIYARQVLYFICLKSDVPADEVALNLDCAVSDVLSGATEFENEMTKSDSSKYALSLILTEILGKKAAK